MCLTNKQYDILKFIILYVLPPVTTLYVAIAGTWGLPYAEQVAATLTSIDTCLVAILGSADKAYKNQLIDKAVKGE